jgi:hypothetical protein
MGPCVSREKEAPKLVLVSSQDPRVCVFSDSVLQAFKRGEPVLVTLKSHPGFAVVSAWPGIRKADRKPDPAQVPRDLPAPIRNHILNSTTSWWHQALAVGPVDAGAVKLCQDGKHIRCANGLQADGSPEAAGGAKYGSWEELDGVTMVTYKPGHKLHCTESVESTDFFFGGGQPFIVGTSQGKQQLCATEDGGLAHKPSGKPSMRLEDGVAKWNHGYESHPYRPEMTRGMVLDVLDPRAQRDYSRKGCVELSYGPDEEETKGGRGFEVFEDGTIGLAGDGSTDVTDLRLGVEFQPEPLLPEPK